MTAKLQDSGDLEDQPTSRPEDLADQKICSNFSDFLHE
jgi:hypothetical protein